MDQKMNDLSLCEVYNRILKSVYCEHSAKSMFEIQSM